MNNNEFLHIVSYNGIVLLIICNMEVQQLYGTPQARRKLAVHDSIVVQTP